MTDGFVFDERLLHVKISDRAMLDALRKCSAQRAGQGVRLSEFDAWPERPCQGTTIARRFGGWRRAQLKAGIKYARGGNHTPADLMDVLEKVWREVERPPGSPVISKIGKVSPAAYARFWGSLAHARRRLAMFHRGEISRQELETPQRRTSPPNVQPRLRWQVLQRDHRRCTACGRQGSEPGVVLEVDHIVPRSRGGTNELANLRTLCRDCNRGKGALHETPAPQ